MAKANLKGVLTKIGAKKLDVPHLAGEIVEYQIVPGLKTAQNVFCNGKYIGSSISIKGSERGIVPLDRGNA